MGQAHMIGFALIAFLYLVVGIMAASGTICTFRKIFSLKSEEIFYAMFLILIAGYYLAFAAYFGAAGAWRMETAVVAGIVAIALLGVRLPVALIVGFALHGLWDFLHELQAHGVYSGFEHGQLTAIPLAYGFFCAAFDFYVAAYFYRR